MTRLLLGLWRLAISPVSFVVIALLWCLDLGIGSLLADKRPDLFGGMDAYPFKIWLELEAPRAWPASLWVHGLVVLSWLMVASLLLCTLNWFLYRRKRFRGVGEVLVHLGFLLVFAGFVIGSAFGARTLGVKLPIGGSTRIAALDVTLTLRDLKPLTGANGEVQGAVSNVELSSRNSTTSSSRVMINHPLIAGTTVVYPRGVQQQVEGARIALAGSSLMELRPGRSLPLPGGTILELGGILQPEETLGNARGPGILVVERNRAGTRLTTAYLAQQEGMPAEGVIAGQRVALAELLGPIMAVYDVHRDPGIWLVLVGAVLITVGTFWSLWGYLREGQ
jgi:cytochrome c biogenesis factor